MDALSSLPLLTHLQSAFNSTEAINAKIVVA
jgi:hypothetical protein